MQQELLDDYRIRLIQLRKESFAVTSPQYSAILNTTYYIVCVLREWADDPVSSCSVSPSLILPRFLDKINLYYMDSITKPIAYSRLVHGTLWD